MTEFLCSLLVFPILLVSAAAVLAHSCGRDTSVILKWLKTTDGCEVVTFTADPGQGEALGPARRKAEMV